MIRREQQPDPGGVEFGPCLGRAVPRQLLGVDVLTISLDDLIAHKRATGRAKDAIDAVELERIRRRLHGQ